MSTKGFIIILPKFDYSQIRPAELAINSIRKSVATIQDANLPNVKVWVTGEVGLEDDELSGMSTVTASIFSIVWVCIILLIAYRSVLFTVATLLTLALGMVFCVRCGFFSQGTEFNFGRLCGIQHGAGGRVRHPFLFATETIWNTISTEVGLFIALWYRRVRL